MIKTWTPRYVGNTIYGAMAFLKAHAGSEQMAETKGLFAIRATGNSASVVDAKSFMPRAFYRQFFPSYLLVAGRC